MFSAIIRADKTLIDDVGDLRDFFFRNIGVEV